MRSDQAPQNNQAGLEDRPVLLPTDFVSNHAMRLLRNIRRELAPNGSSINTPARQVDTSGTATCSTLASSK
jgi:hypothetical protein